MPNKHKYEFQPYFMSVACLKSLKGYFLKQVFKTDVNREKRKKKKER